eukprot:9315514-Pyramimonas_sp.AAC.1
MTEEASKTAPRAGPDGGPELTLRALGAERSPGGPKRPPRSFQQAPEGPQENPREAPKGPP